MIADSARSIVLPLLLITLFMVGAARSGEPGEEPIVVNGVTLDEQEIESLESEIGRTFKPGSYVVDIASGCWANMTNNESSCEPVEYHHDVTYDTKSTTAKLVSINGISLDQEQIDDLEAYVGTQIVPGQYLVNYLNGCWMNVANGQGGCPDSNQGSGESIGNGDWSHWSDAAGGGVGGTGDGCVYAFGWSNC